MQTMPTYWNYKFTLDLIRSVHIFLSTVIRVSVRILCLASIAISDGCKTPIGPA